MNIQSDGTAEGTVIYQYTPSESAGYAFVTLFGLATVTHVALAIYHRTPYFTWMILGGIMEAAAYYGRAWSSHDPHNFKAYILYILLSLAAPPFIAATIYMALSRITTTLNAKNHSVIKPRWLTTVFILVDIINFTTQLGGAGMQATTSPSVQATGRKLVAGGLIFQIICFALFVLVAATFYSRNNRRTGSISQEHTVKWRRHLWALYIASVAILVRNVFRIIEYTQSHYGSIARHEAYIYVLDAFLMWSVMVVYAVIHPGVLRRQVRRVQKETGLVGRPELVGVSMVQETGVRPWS